MDNLTQQGWQCPNKYGVCEIRLGGDVE